jgi:hypothetical protein
VLGRGRRRGRVTRAGGRPRRSGDGGQAKDDRSNIWEPALLSGRASGRWQCGGLGRPLGAPPLRQWTEASAVRLAGLGNGGRRWAVGRWVAVMHQVRVGVGAGLLRESWTHVGWVAENETWAPAHMR